MRRISRFITWLKRIKQKKVIKKGQREKPEKIEYRDISAI